MIHASDLRYRTLCGLVNMDLPLGDHSYAALIPETQAQVTCITCREKLGLEVSE